MNILFRFSSCNWRGQFGVIALKMEETIMRTLAIMAATLGLIGTFAVGSAAPAAADWYYGHHHRYYNYGGGTWNGCRPGWTVQGGVCKPYQGPRSLWAPPGSRFWWQ